MADGAKRSRFFSIGRLIVLLQMWWTCLSLFIIWDLGHAVLVPPPILMGIGAALTLFFIFLVSRLVPPPRRVLVAGVALAICGLISFGYPKLVENDRKPASGSREAFLKRGGNCESLITKYVLPEKLPNLLFPLGYLTAMLDDVCRVQRLSSLAKHRAELICSDLSEPRPVACFVRAMEEISSRAPLTIFGNALELTSALSVVAQEGKLDRAESSSAETGLRTSIRLLQVFERALLDYRTIITPRELPGYLQASNGEPIQQRLVMELDQNARTLYKRLLPIHAVKVMKQASDEFTESAPKVTEEKKSRYAARYDEQKARVSQLLSTLR